MKMQRSFSHSSNLTTLLAAALSLSTAGSAFSQIYHWDTNGATAGFGTASGTWDSPTPGPATGWSTDPTGATAIGSVTTGVGNEVRFGTDTDGLASGTVTINGTVNSSHIRFGKASGAITLDGGTINMDAGTEEIEAVSGGGTAGATHTINSDITKSGGTLRVGTQSTTNERYILNGVLSGAFGLDGRVRNGSGVLTLNGLNTFTGNAGLVTGQYDVNTLADAGAASSLGAGNTITMGGGGGQQPRLVYTGTAAASTDRTLRVNANTTGIIAQNGPVDFSGSIEAVGGSRNQVLTGTADTGTNTVSGVMNDGTGTLRVEIQNLAATGVTGEAAFWQFTGANTYTGTTSIFDNSTLQLGDGGTTGSLSTSSAITVDAGSTFVVNQSDTVTQGVDFSNSLSGAGNVTMSGTGELVLEWGTASYTGLTTVENGGTLRIQENNQGTGQGIPTWGGANFAINGASTLILEDTTSTENRSIVNGETFTFDATGGGTLDVGSTGNIIWRNNNTIVTSGGAQNTFTGRINMQNSHETTFDVAPGTDPSGIDLLASVNIQGGDIIKDGAGTVSLTHPTNNLGSNGGIPNTITINDGTLKIGGAGRIQSGNYSGAITNDATFEYNSTANQTLSGVISGTGEVIKDNTGTLTLTAANTYTGKTTIEEGILALTGAGSIDNSSEIAIDADGTLDITAVTGGTYNFSNLITGSGTILGNLSMMGGEISPGDTSGADLGTLDVTGDLAVDANTAITLQLTNALGNVPGLSSAFLQLDPIVDFGMDPSLTLPEHDSIHVTGNLNLDPATPINISLAGYTPMVGDYFDLFDFDTPTLIGGTLNLPALSGLNWDTSLFASEGIIAIIPEPSRTLLIGVGIVGLLLRRRR